MSHHVGDLFLGGDYKVPAAKLSRVTSKEMAYDGKIVECAVDTAVPGGGWKVLRVRTDKTEPNHQSVGLSKSLIVHNLCKASLPYTILTLGGLGSIAMIYLYC